MSDETKTEVTEPAENQEKSFTQSEVDRMISQRLEREKAKFTDYDTIKEKAETLEAKLKEREEAELSELEKAKKQIEDMKKELESHKVNTEWRKTFEQKEKERIEKETEGLTESQINIINALPLDQRMVAVQEFKTSSNPSPDISKGVKVKSGYTNEELLELKNKYGAGSSQYLNALKQHFNKGE